MEKNKFEKCVRKCKNGQLVEVVFFRRVLFLGMRVVEANNYFAFEIHHKFLEKKISLSTEFEWRKIFTRFIYTVQKV